MRHSPHKINEFIFIAMSLVQLVNFQFTSLMRHSPHKIKRKEFILKVNFPMNSFLSILRGSLLTHKKSTNPNNLMFKLVPLVRLQGLEPWTPWLRVRCSSNWANGPICFLREAQTELYYRNIVIASIFWKKNKKQPDRGTHDRAVLVS